MDPQIACAQTIGELESAQRHGQRAKEAVRDQVPLDGREVLRDR